VNCEDFEILGDVIPPALRADTRGERSTVTARLGWAKAIALQLRRRDQLLPTERHEGRGQGLGYWMELDDAKIEPLGDLVLEAERDEVLTLLARRLYDVSGLKKRVTESWPDLRVTYGYDASEWTKRPAPSRPPHRVALRIGICLAADATFAPFARGLVDAISRQQASLRIDLRSAAAAMWAWASCDYPALARCLVIARTGIDGKPIGFPAFEELFRRVLGNHLGTGIDDPDQVTDIAIVAKGLDRLTTSLLYSAPQPGHAATGLNASIVEFVAEKQPGWIRDAVEEDPEEIFAAGAAPLVLDVLLGRLQPTDVAEKLDALRLGLEATRGGEPSA
jgi:hypothetical protein